jgi:hypothetical protein
MSLKRDIDNIFLIIKDLEQRQKRGETATKQEVENLKSLTLTLESIAESMVPEKRGSRNS